MGIKGRLIISFSIIIAILVFEIVLNQIISNNAANAYNKLKVEALPTIQTLNKFEAINKEAFLLINGKVYNEELSQSDDNRLSGILEVEYPFLKAELVPVGLHLKDNELLQSEVNLILAATDSITKNSGEILRLLRIKEDYEDLSRTKRSRKIVESKLAVHYARVNSGIMKLELHYKKILSDYQQEFADNLSSLSSIILITGLVGVFVALMISFQVIRSITKPIAKLQMGAKQLGAGDYGSEIEWDGQDELSDLVRSFNSMSRSLDENFKLIKERNSEILEQEDRFRKVIEASPAGLLLIDRSGKIVLVNFQVENLFDYQRGQLVSKSLSRIFPAFEMPDGRDFTYHECQKILQKSLERSEDISGLMRRGRHFPVELFIDEIRIKNETYVLLSVLDITERRANEIQIKKYVEQLESKNKELEHFTYITSHDLQEPLLTIISYSDLIKEKYNDKLGPEVNQMMSFMREASMRMRGLIKGLLDHSRIGTQKGFEIVDCNEVVKSVLNDLDKSIKKSDAEIRVDPLPELLAYPLEIRMLFQNLISNAIKFTPKGKSPRVVVSHCSNDRDWIFFVEDQGIGVPEESIDRIFDIFYRLNKRSEFEGVGVGLAHVKKIAEAHNGRVWVESDGHSRSKFYFSFPSS